MITALVAFSIGFIVGKNTTAKNLNKDLDSYITYFNYTEALLDTLNKV